MLLAMESTSSANASSMLESPCSRGDRSLFFRSLFSKKATKDLLAFSNLQLQIPELETLDAENSPTSVVDSSGYRNEFDSPHSLSRYQNSFSVLPYNSGNLSDDYILTPIEIGRGRSGVVRECIHKFSGEVLACKSVDKSSMKPRGRRAEALMLEVNLAFVLSNHPNIIKFHQIYEDSLDVHFVMEKCIGGDLFDLITKKERLSEMESARLLNKITQAVAYSHSKGIVHRDIKPENIMIDNPRDMEPKLGDFGQSFVISYDEYPCGIAGSPPYMAPEVILGIPYSFPVDVWSLGILLYIMLSGLLPFHGRNPVETFEFILSYEPNLVSSPWDTISPGAKSLVRRMLLRDPGQRSTISEVLSDPWLRALSSDVL